MYNITLVCTRHDELGKCNSDELYKIIESINPEIIFEELSHLQFMEAYLWNVLKTLETNAIKMYLQNHTINHIPVDTYKRPYLDTNSMEVIFNCMLDESRKLRELVDNHKLSLKENGFNYLNSKQNDDFFEKYNILKEKVLDVIKNKNLFRISELEKEVIDKREYEIIENIYNYSKKNQYNQALLFIGSGHRKSIIEKIKKYTQDNIKLNWTLFQC